MAERRSGAGRRREHLKEGRLRERRREGELWPPEVKITPFKVKDDTRCAVSVSLSVSR